MLLLHWNFVKIRLYLCCYHIVFMLVIPWIPFSTTFYCVATTLQPCILHMNTLYSCHMYIALFSPLLSAFLLLSELCIIPTNTVFTSWHYYTECSLKPDRVLVATTTILYLCYFLVFLLLLNLINCRTTLSPSYCNAIGCNAMFANVVRFLFLILRHCIYTLHYVILSALSWLTDNTTLRLGDYSILLLIPPHWFIDINTLQRCQFTLLFMLVLHCIYMLLHSIILHTSTQLCWYSYVT